MPNDNNIQVAALTGGLNTPSTRFRVRQYIPYLAQMGVEVTEHIPRWGESCGLPSPFKMVSRIPALFRSRKADIVWISRDLVQGYGTFERCLKHPRILDVDDSIWLSRPLGWLCQPYVARGMDAIVVGNDHLADYYSQYCKDIHILPTAIDTARFTPRVSSSVLIDGKFVLGWTGLACNYRYLQDIEPALKLLFEKYDHAQLLIISNRPYETSVLPPEKIRYVQWTPDNEASILHEMSVGLMPLPDNKWTLGKCSFKMLQYMASALPVVASPVGMNKQVFEKGDVGFAAADIDQWYQALESLCASPEKAAEQGVIGRQVIEEYYSAESVALQWSRIFKKYAP